ncbi:MAG TPA: hypothetical protein PKB00_16045 [Microthrixaceae bacterium]|nr:hypothetical protein [Microthrixaceae bacterium]
MATFVSTAAHVNINSVDLSDDCTSLGLDISADELEDTAFGDTYRSRVGSALKDTQWSVDFNQDHASGQVDATLWAAFNTVVTVYANPATSSSSPTNPRYSQSVLISKYAPFGNGVGELATVSCQWPGAGTLSRATS